MLDTPEFCYFWSYVFTRHIAGVLGNITRASSKFTDESNSKKISKNIYQSYEIISSGTLFHGPRCRSYNMP